MAKCIDKQLNHRNEFRLFMYQRMNSFDFESLDKLIGFRAYSAVKKLCFYASSVRKPIYFWGLQWNERCGLQSYSIIYTALPLGL